MWLIFVPVCQVQASRGRESILGTVKDLGPRKELGFLPEILGREDSSARVPGCMPAGDGLGVGMKYPCVPRCSTIYFICLFIFIYFKAGSYVFQVVLE